MAAARTAREGNLAQWGDVRTFCDAAGTVDRSVVPGASFGGMVALPYTMRLPPTLPGALRLNATQNKTGALGRRF